MDNGLFIEIMAMIVFASIIGFIALRKIKFGNQAIKSYAYIINADNTISVLPVKSLRDEKITLENNSYMVYLILPIFNLLLKSLFFLISFNF